MVGIALEGGGARGAYEAGAYIALINNGIKPRWIAGTSIGALNAAMMASKDIKKLIDLWLNATTDIVGINSLLITKIKNKTFDKDSLKLGYDNFKQILKNKGIDTTNFFKLVKENLDEKKLRKSKIKFGLITVRVKGMVPVELTIDDIPEGKVAEYILASCYLPIFSFKKIIDDNYYLDGGFYNNLPLSLLENQGCDTIYAIRLRSLGFVNNKLKKETKVIEIKPKKKLGSMVFFDKDSNEKNMKLGYYDALKVIKNLDGEDYYFYRKSIKYYERITRKVKTNTKNILKKKFHTKNDKELVIKVVEYLLNKYNVDNLSLYNIKKQIRYLRKHNLVEDKDLKAFIYSCKFF